MDKRTAQPPHWSFSLVNIIAYMLFFMQTTECFFGCGRNGGSDCHRDSREEPQTVIRKPQGSSPCLARQHIPTALLLYQGCCSEHRPKSLSASPVFKNSSLGGKCLNPSKKPKCFQQSVFKRAVGNGVMRRSQKKDVFGCFPSATKGGRGEVTNVHTEKTLVSGFSSL